MPVARYFMFVGGVLLALLFAVDFLVPKEPVMAATAAAASVENPTLRIRSDQKWPERVVYDTSLPVIVPPPAPKAVAAVVPAPAAEVTATKADLRESFAQVTTPALKKPEPQAQPKRKVVRRTGPPVRLVAQHPNFGFFGNSTW